MNTLSWNLTVADPLNGTGREEGDSHLVGLKDGCWGTDHTQAHRPGDSMCDQALGREAEKLTPGQRGRQEAESRDTASTPHHLHLPHSSPQAKAITACGQSPRFQGAARGNGHQQLPAGHLSKWGLRPWEMPWQQPQPTFHLTETQEALAVPQRAGCKGRGPSQTRRALSWVHRRAGLRQDRWRTVYLREQKEAKFGAGLTRTLCHVAWGPVTPPSLVFLI